MSFVITTPQILATAAADLADIGATVSEADAAAAAVTTGLVPAAQDEVSQAIGALFGGYAQEYHALSAQAAEFQEQLVQTLSASAASYLAAEGANAAALLQTARQDVVNAVNATSESLLGRALIASGTGTSSVTGSAVVSAADQRGQRGNDVGHGRQRHADTDDELPQHREQPVPAAQSVGDQPAGR